MNSLNRDAKDSSTTGYSVCPSSAPESMPISSERMAIGGARFQYLDNCAPLAPIELPGVAVAAPTTSANLTELESTAGLVYVQHATPVSLQHQQHQNHHAQDYFSSASFNSLNRAPPQTYASLVSAPMHLQEESLGGGGGGGISFATSIGGSNQHGGSYMDAFARSGTSAPLQHIIGSLTTKLPELHSGAASVPSHDLLSYQASSLQRSSAGDSSHVGLISPAYSPSSVTTQGSGSSKQTRSAGQPGEEKVGVCKSRSKKESHNRIERRRRDYINSQIARLSSLLPPELYRDVDGRRNKGTVLRLSVTYIMELRHALSQAAHIRQETSIARQLIPLLLNHMQALENVVKEVASASNAPDLPSSLLELTSDTGSYEITLEAWKLAVETNIAHSMAAAASTSAAAANDNTSTPDPSCGSQSEAPHRTPCSHGSSSDLHNLPLLENMQVSFGGPIQQQQQQQQPRLPSSSSSSLQLQLSSPANYQTATGRVDPVYLTGLKQEDEDHQHQQQQQQQQHQQDFAAMIAAAAAATRTNGKQETGRMAAEEDFGDFQEKSNDIVNGYYDDPNVQTFDEMMQMTTDCVVEPVQPIECQNR